MMQETRQEILEVLRLQEGATLSTLAEVLGLSVGTLRHHLNVLDRDGLVTKRRERHGVGKPRHVYELSSKGEERFPKKYVELLSALLHQLKAEMDRASIEQLVRKMATKALGIKLDHCADLAREKRIQLLREILEAEGFLPRIEERDDPLHIMQRACPYQAAAMEHVELCQIDKEIIECCLGRNVELEAWRPDGDRVCIFVETQDPLAAQGA